MQGMRDNEEESPRACITVRAAVTIIDYRHTRQYARRPTTTAV